MADPSIKIEQATAPSRDIDYDDGECGNCGGEGFTYGCSWDWQCDTYDEGEGTCLCTRRCEWCNSPSKQGTQHDAMPVQSSAA